MNPNLEDRRKNVQLDLRGMDRNNRKAEAALFIRDSRPDLFCECGDVVGKSNWALHRNHEKVMIG